MGSESGPAPAANSDTRHDGNERKAWSMTDNDKKNSDIDSAATTVGAADDETTIVPDFPTRSAPELAWSTEEDETEGPAGHKPWGAAWRNASIVAGGAALLATGIGVGGWLLHTPPSPSMAPTTQASTPSAPVAQPPVSTPSAVAPSPAPAVPPSIPVTSEPPPAPTSFPQPASASGVAMGLPCNASEHGKLAHDPATGAEIFCHAEVTGSGQWEATPSAVTGVQIEGSSCAGQQLGDNLPLSRSTDGYLVTCEPASYAGPLGGSTMIWQRYRAIFDPGT
jgi:hypothetical protein